MSNNSKIRLIPIPHINNSPHSSPYPSPQTSPRNSPRNSSSKSLKLEAPISPQIALLSLPRKSTPPSSPCSSPRNSPRSLRSSDTLETSQPISLNILPVSTGALPQRSSSHNSASCISSRTSNTTSFPSIPRLQLQRSISHSNLKAPHIFSTSDSKPKRSTSMNILPIPLQSYSPRLTTSHNNENNSYNLFSSKNLNKVKFENNITFFNTLSETIENGIKKNLKQEKSIFKIDNLELNLSSQFIQDLKRINYYILKTDGQQQDLVERNASEPISKQRIKGLLEFLGYQSSEDLTHEQLTLNEATIQTLENLSFTANQWIGIETAIALQGIQKSSEYPLQFEGAKFQFPSFNLSTNILLSRNQNGSFILKNETLPYRKQQPFDYILDLNGHNDEQIHLNPYKSDFYGQITLSLDRLGRLNRVENGSWHYTLVKKEEEANEEVIEIQQGPKTPFVTETPQFY